MLPLFSTYFLKMDTPDYRSYGPPEDVWEPEIIDVNGVSCEFHGIAHDLGVFEHFQEQLEDAIKRAAIVFMEGAPEALQFCSSDNLQALHDLYLADGIDEPLDQMKQRIESNGGVPFFGRLEKFAAHQNKRIAVVDPQFSLAESYRLFKKDDNANGVKSLTALVAITGAVGSNALRALGGKKDEDSPKDSSGIMSRRRMLKLLAGTIGLAAGTSRIASTFDANDGSNNNVLHSAHYDVFDYRNIVVGKGLNLLTEVYRKELGEEPIVLIYGNRHRRGIKHYLHSPGERELKYSLYAPIRGKETPQLQIFEPEEGGKMWKKVMTETIN